MDIPTHIMVNGEKVILKPKEVESILKQWEADAIEVQKIDDEFRMKEEKKLEREAELTKLIEDSKKEAVK